VCGLPLYALSFTFHTADCHIVLDREKEQARMDDYLFSPKTFPKADIELNAVARPYLLAMLTCSPSPHNIGLHLKKNYTRICPIYLTEFFCV
jgi:hypothetical protein